MPSPTINLTPQHESEAAALMARAFAGDALMRYLFDAEAAGYATRLHGFFRYTATVHRTLGWPMLGVMARTRLAGAAYLATPDQTNWPAALDTAFADFSRTLSSESLERMQRYANVPSRGMPNVPHFYVKAIGVRPESQGRGYAHALLDAAHKLTQAHPTAQGIALDTEKAANVPFYERIGYTLVASVPFDGINVLYMFRKNSA